MRVGGRVGRDGPDQDAAVLIGLLLAIGSGTLMHEHWLRSGELEHWPYHLHLLAWLIISGAVIWHVGDVVRRAASPLA